MEKAESWAEGVTSLFKVLSKPDALRLLSHTSDGIGNSTYAIEELGLTPKKYYARLRELVDIGLVRKWDSVYRQTALGRMIYDRFLPSMVKAVDARDELEFLVGLEGLKMENGVRKRILEELKIPDFAGSTKVRLLGDYEAMVVEVIDICDEAKESVLLASNYVDVRVMEATFRAVDRDVTNRVIMGKSSLSSKMQSLRIMFSLTFTKALINFASSTKDLKGVVRSAEIPYSFCIGDGHRSIIEISDTLKEGFIVALSIDDRVVAENLLEFFNALWKAGEAQSAIEAIDLLRSN